MTIQNILLSNKPSDLFPKSGWRPIFNQAVILCHPDKNSSTEAGVAYEKLLKYKEILEEGIKFKDEHCTITFKDNMLTFVGEPTILKTSYDNYHLILKSVPSNLHFHRYLPEKMELNGGELKVYLREDSVLIHNLTLEQKHVKWVLNRILEFASLLNATADWVHVGLNPNSVLICPEGHGIQIVSFYHSKKVNTKLSSVIGMLPYKNWYPSEIFANPIATSEIDLLMAKRIAIYLLGDRSGFGTSLRGKIDIDLLNFLLNFEGDVRDTYLRYQDLLNKYPRVFHKLEL